jgi:TonB family protein
MRLGSVLLVVLLGLTTVPRALSADARSAQGGESQSGRKIINKVIPIYPSTARNMRLTGTVKLEVLVLANGTVKSIQVKGGNPLLAQAAQSAARECKWAKSDHESTEAMEFRFTP